MTTTTAISTDTSLTVNLARHLWSRLDLGAPEGQSGELIDTMISTLMKGEVSDAQVQAFLLVAAKHKLNPWLKEIHAFVDSRSGGIVPVVGIDGWINIIQSHPEFDGMEIDYGDVGGEKAVTCSIWRKDRTRPTVITEFMSECKGSSPAWSKTPRRMLRHRAIMQCGRVAFGISGIHAPDDAETFAAPMGSAQSIDPETGAETDLMPTSRTPSPAPAPKVPSDRNFDTTDAIDVPAREVKKAAAATPPPPPAQPAAKAAESDLPWSDDPPPAERDAGARAAPPTPAAATIGDPNRPATDGEKANLVNRAKAAGVILRDELTKLNLDPHCEGMTKAQFELVKAHLVGLA